LGKNLLGKSRLNRTPAERLDRAFRKALTVPKEAILKHEQEETARRAKKRAAKRKAH